MGNSDGGCATARDTLFTNKLEELSCKLRDANNLLESMIGSELDCPQVPHKDPPKPQCVNEDEISGSWMGSVNTYLNDVNRQADSLLGKLNKITGYI